MLRVVINDTEAVLSLELDDHRQCPIGVHADSGTSASDSMALTITNQAFSWAIRGHMRITACELTLTPTREFVAAAILLADQMALGPALESDDDVDAYGSGGSVHVRGYRRRDGTYVAPHSRHRPRR